MACVQDENATAEEPAGPVCRTMLTKRQRRQGLITEVDDDNA
jgi:hypothetical protein